MRVDSGVGAGSEISPSYDPMVAKLIVWDTDREAATARMRRALGEFEIGGLTTLLPFHQRLLATEQWARAETCRDLIEDDEWLAGTASRTRAAAGARATTPAHASTTRSRSAGGASRCASAARQNGDDARAARRRARGRRDRGARAGAPAPRGGDALHEPDAGDGAEDRRRGRRHASRRARWSRSSRR